MVITVYDPGSIGPLDHFAISAIASPQTVGIPITGITLTAQDASSNTVTSFTGSVNFGGSGGFSGTSAAFTNGVLSGVNVTPTNAGSNLTFTVKDNVSGKDGSTTITTIRTQYAAWSGGIASGADSNNDGIKNGLAWLLGAPNPSAAAIHLLPSITKDSGNLVLTFSCLNAASRGNSVLNVEHSSDLGVSGGPWVSVIVPEITSSVGGVNFTITPNGNLNNVVARIPLPEGSAGSLFGRIRAAMPP